MKATINYRTSNTVVKMSQGTAGALTTTGSAVGLRNQVNELRSIEDIADVDEINVTDGATLIYNAERDKYEVKPISLESLGLGNLDGGTF